VQKVHKVQEVVQDIQGHKVLLVQKVHKVLEVVQDIQGHKGL
jgi:hypothetical protein